MNRAERRRLEKKLKHDGISMEKFNDIANLNNNNNYIQEGTKVKLNIERIKGYKDYKNMNKKYIEWVESHEDNVFTVEHGEDTKKNPTLVQLKEDASDPKWLFWWGDLIVVE